MAEDPSLNDVLSPALQTALAAKLVGGEDVLMSLAGAHGEGLVVTDLRVMILREQMPIVGAQTEVDCFDYSYEQIHAVRLENAAGGAFLKLVLVAPPPDDQRVTLYFNSFDLDKFEQAAARIRLLIEQTGDVPTAASRPCPQCGAAVRPADLFCAACGAAQGDVCGYCQTLLAPHARFCTHCGIPAENGRALACPSCSFSIAPFFVFCPQCGQLLGQRCRNCGAPAIAGWSRCATCGRNLDAAPTVPVAGMPSGGAPTGEPPGGQRTAEEHNAQGMRLYEQEQYEEAVQEFEAALDLAPGTALYHCNLGVALVEMGREDEALEEYQTAIRLAPNDPTPYLNLGYYYSEREDADQARAAWERVIALAPSGPEADEARQNLQNMGGV